jgi:hypothetical protein
VTENKLKNNFFFEFFLLEKKAQIQTLNIASVNHCSSRLGSRLLGSVGGLHLAGGPGPYFVGFGQGLAAGT